MQTLASTTSSIDAKNRDWWVLLGPVLTGRLTVDGIPERLPHVLIGECGYVRASVVLCRYSSHGVQSAALSRLATSSIAMRQKVPPLHSFEMSCASRGHQQAACFALEEQDPEGNTRAVALRDHRWSRKALADEYQLHACDVPTLVEMSASAAQALTQFLTPLNGGARKPDWSAWRDSSNAGDPMPETGRITRYLLQFADTADAWAALVRERADRCQGNRQAPPSVRRSPGRGVKAGRDASGW